MVQPSTMAPRYPQGPRHLCFSPPALLHDFELWGCLLCTKLLLHCQTFHLSSRQRQRGIRGEARSGIMLVIPSNKLRGPLNNFYSYFTGWNLIKCLPHLQKKSGRCSFCRHIYILSPPPPNQSFFRKKKKKGENEFGVVNCPSGIVFPSQLNTSLLR